MNMNVNYRLDVEKLCKNKTTVKVSLTKNDAPEKWILTTINEVLSLDDYCPDGVEVLIADNRSGYCKDFENSFVELTSSELAELIEKHETFNFELKSSFQWSIKKNEKAECLGEQVVKEIAAFMNSKGGKICIGVDDQRKTLGLKPDFSISPGRSGQTKEDALVSKIRNFVRDRLNSPTTQNLFNSYVMKYDQKQVCIIDVEESSIPIFIYEKFVPSQCDKDGQPLKIRKWSFYTRTDQGVLEHSPYEAKSYWLREKNTSFL
ncbi:ATP-binding protein [Nitrosopumilus sp.]|jgi:predicted HTH transcriptional regulator|nr:ATP-binding protein [Nitrosopumilus sp.]